MNTTTRTAHQILNQIARGLGNPSLKGREYTTAERQALVAEAERVIDAQWGLDGSASDWLLGLLAELETAN